VAKGTTSEARKNAAKARWVSGKTARSQRAAAQQAAAQRNRAAGTSPWKEACAARYARHEAAKREGRWEPAVRSPLGLIQRSDGQRSWYEDPGVRERSHVTGIPVNALRGRA
jgi:short subunit dehydrogenase-like uncharacterized protein